MAKQFGVEGVTNKELFDRWMALKFDIQSLAAIVQNDDIELTQEDFNQWLVYLDQFRNKLTNIVLETTIFMKVKE